jgi:hypothetical protein
MKNPENNRLENDESLRELLQKRHELDEKLNQYTGR